MALPTISYADSSGELRAVYDQMLARPMPPAYRTNSGTIPAIIQAHSTDPQLILRVFQTSSTLLGEGPLTWTERELVASVTSRINQCWYCTACHVEFLRQSQNGDRELALAVVTSPQTLRSAAPRLRHIAEIAALVTEAPWLLSAAHRDLAHSARIDDDAILQIIALAAFLGHLNRMADAVSISLDYDVEIKPPEAHPESPPFWTAPIAISNRPVLELSRRPATESLMTAWRTYITTRDAPLHRRQRTVIARWVALWLGDGGISSPVDLTVNPLDDALRELAETITLAPWRMPHASFAPLRSAGLDDAALFEACAVASSCGMFSRIAVALAALGREKA